MARSRKHLGNFVLNRCPNSRRRDLSPGLTVFSKRTRMTVGISVCIPVIRIDALNRFGQVDPRQRHPLDPSSRGFLSFPAVTLPQRPPDSRTNVLFSFLKLFMYRWNAVHSRHDRFVGHVRISPHPPLYRQL